MTTLRRIFAITVAAAALSSVASANIIIGYTTTIGPTQTDITDFTAVLPAWNPGDSNFTPSNVSGGGYTTGVTMNSLSASTFTYTLVGFNITVKETLTGNYSITNNSTNSPANGSAHIDTYTAVALNAVGNTLAPPLTNTVDPANDLFRCAVTGTGLPSSTCAPGEQSTSPGGGPDPNSPQTSTFNIPVGGTFTSDPLNVNSKFVDYGCEVSSQTFCSDNAITGALANELFTGLGLVTGPPDLTFDFSTATQTTTTVSGGNLQSTYNTNVTEQVTVTYEYSATTAAPEPTTMALFGGALLGLGLLGKRIRKS